MKIELTDDNGMLHDGKPTLVVLVIDGVTRIPYEATKTIQELYEDVGKFTINSINKEASELSGVNIIPKSPLVLNPDNVTLPLNLRPSDFIVERATKSERDLLEQDKAKLIDLSTIQKEDIVKCVKIHPRDDGLTNVEVPDSGLVIGNEYRVFRIKIELDKLIFYEIIDDNSKDQQLISCLPDEIELLRKRKVKTNHVKKDYKQEIMKCAQCRTDNALDLVGDKYIGECVKCQARLEKPRPIAKPTA